MFVYKYDELWNQGERIEMKFILDPYIHLVDLGNKFIRLFGN